MPFNAAAMLSTTRNWLTNPGGNQRYNSFRSQEATMIRWHNPSTVHASCIGSQRSLAIGQWPRCPSGVDERISSSRPISILAASNPAAQLRGEADGCPEHRWCPERRWHPEHRWCPEQRWNGTLRYLCKQATRKVPISGTRSENMADMKIRENVEPLKKPEIERDSIGRFERKGKLAKSAKSKNKQLANTGQFQVGADARCSPGRPPGSLNK